MKHLRPYEPDAHCPEVEASALNMTPLQNPLVRNAMVCLILLWMWYMVNGFRLPTTPIVLSDSDAGSGIRQLIFGGSGCFAFAMMFFTKSISRTIALRFEYFAIIALLLVSALWSEQTTLSLKRGIIFVFGAITLMVLVQAASKPVLTMFRIVVYGCGSFALLSVLFSILLPSNCTTNPGRGGLAGIAVHPNTLGPFLSIGFLISLGFQAVEPRERMLVRGFQAVTFAALLMTQSMTSLVTTIVGIGCYVFLAANHYRQGLLQLLCVAAVSFVLLVGIDTLKGSFFESVGRDESFSGRDELWRTIAFEVGKEPLLGHGYGAFWTEGKGRELVQTWNPRQSHHAYLDILLDLGLLGLVMVILLFPLRLALLWIRLPVAKTKRGRTAMAAMYAAVFAYLGIYAFGQSYLLRFDSFPFFVTFWITLLVTNLDENRMEIEFPMLLTPNS